MKKVVFMTLKTRKRGRFPLFFIPRRGIGNLFEASLSEEYNMFDGKSKSKLCYNCIKHIPLVIPIAIIYDQYS